MNRRYFDPFRELKGTGVTSGCVFFFFREGLVFQSRRDYEDQHRIVTSGVSVRDSLQFLWSQFVLLLDTVKGPINTRGLRTMIPSSL